MRSRVSSVSIVGMDAHPVEVEVATAPGLPEFHIVGLPSAAVREARRRVTAALQSTQSWSLSSKITVNLAPGDLRKEGALLDLAMAVGILAADRGLTLAEGSNFFFIGELALDGRIRPVRGALAAALAARREGADGVVVPLENRDEASLVPGIKVAGAESLVEALAFASGDLEAESKLVTPTMPPEPPGGPDLSEVKGQALARRALEIAASGGHNLLLVGPPGSGKTMLARRLPGILPQLSVEEALEVTQIWSVAGLLPAGQGLVSVRPFRAPHHHASAPAIVGGGSPTPRPGEVSLANHGVLFLDELPLFGRGVLDGLRQPLEDGVVTVARQGATVTFPAKLSLVAAANPCPCGRLGEAGISCSCPPVRLDSYRSRLSGPLLDRFDLFAEVPRITESELLELGDSECSASVRSRVVAARGRAITTPRPNGTSSSSFTHGLDGSSIRLLRVHLSKQQLSARGAKAAVRVARTISRLENSDKVEEVHLAEALQFRRVVWS